MPREIDVRKASAPPLASNFCRLSSGLQPPAYTLHPHRGFTLAELAVATTILTIVMTAVYTSFGSTLRAWRLGEAHMQTYQDTRVAMSVISRELSCIVGEAEHLFQGKDDEVEFFCVSQSMNVEKGEGGHVLWVKYRFNRDGKKLVRQEGLVERPLPLRPHGDEEVDHSRIKLTHKRTYELAAGDILDFKITYYWVPPVERKEDEPPEWVEPIELTESREGWGLPQAIKINVTVRDVNAEKGRTTFSLQHTFRGPTTPYDEKRIGASRGTEG